MSHVHCQASVWPGDYLSPKLRSPWAKLHALQNSPGAVYQSAAYFDYLQEVHGAGTLGVLTVTEKDSDAIIGVVPVRRKTIDMPFAVGERRLLNLKVQGLSLLGSEPMAPREDGALDRLFELLTRKYPEADAIELDAVPLGGALWKYLTSSRIIADRYFVHVLHGFRDCHFITLPASVDDYLNRLTKKRRYNYQRQEKLLREHLALPLQLTLIDRPEQIGDLLAAMTRLGALSPAEIDAGRRDFTAAARHGFLYAFVLTAGDRIIGLTLGTKSKQTYRIHRFFHDKQLERFSVGATLWQLVLKRLIADAQFCDVDMGYGTPAYRYSATNTILQKGRLLLFRKTLANRARIVAHSVFSALANRAKASEFAASQARRLER